jgi:hypothetical protein
MRREILTITLASILVAIPTAFASLTFYVGSWTGVVSEPGFWQFYFKAFFWIFVACVAASTITLFATASKK